MNPANHSNHIENQFMIFMSSSDGLKALITISFRAGIPHEITHRHPQGLRWELDTSSPNPHLPFCRFIWKHKQSGTVESHLEKLMSPRVLFSSPLNFIILHGYLWSLLGPKLSRMVLSNPMEMISNPSALHGAVSLLISLWFHLPMPGFGS